MKRLLLATLLAARSVAAPSLSEAQAQLDAGRATEVLGALRPLLAAAPDNPRLHYNYALATYAAGDFPTALAALAEPVAEETPDLRARRLLLLANARARHAATLATANPEGAINLLTQADDALRAAAELPGPAATKATANRPLVQRLAAETMLAQAERLRNDGETAARRAPEDGLPAWLAAHGWTRKAAQVAPGTAASARAQRTAEALAARILPVTLTALRARRQQAARVVTTAPERALSLYEQSLALATDVAAQLGASADLAALATDLRAGLHTARLAQARQLADRARRLPEPGTTEAVALLGKALEFVAAALTAAPAAPDALTLQDEVRATLRDAHEAVGDRHRARAGATVERAAKLEALNAAHAAYGAAQQLRTEAVTTEKIAAVRAALADTYTALGAQALAAARGPTDTRELLEAAIAQAERAVASFRLALTHVPTHAPASTGVRDASALLEELRSRLDQQPTPEIKKSGEDIADAQRIRDLPSNAALKLLDYRNDAPAAKGPQLLTAPENRPLRDW